MSMADRSGRDQTRSKVSFSRGLLRYAEVEEPVVGRRPAMAAPQYTSTPRDVEEPQGAWGGPRVEHIEERMNIMEHRYKEELDWKDVRIGHLEQLLDGERRMVDALSQYAKVPMDYMKARIDTHKTMSEPVDMDMESLTMPVLENMLAKEGSDPEVPGRRGRRDSPVMAREVYTHDASDGAIMTPRVMFPQDKKKNLEPEIAAKDVKVEVRPDLNWYEDYVQQKKEGKWGIEESVSKKKELRSVLSESAASWSGASKGGGAWRCA